MRHFKVRFFKKATKIDEDFVDFCGLLRKHELYMSLISRYSTHLSCLKFWNYWTKFQKVLRTSQKVNKLNEVLQSYQFIKIVGYAPAWPRPIKMDTSGNMLRVHYACLHFEFCVKSSKFCYQIIKKKLKNKTNQIANH